MKKTIIILMLCLLCLGMFAACDNTEQPADTYSISLDQTTLSMGVYEKTSLTATVRNGAGQVSEQAVAWSSANPSVAEVTDGVVFAKGAGKTTVTAQLADGTKAECTVDVMYLGMIAQLSIRNVDDRALSIGKDQIYDLDMAVMYNGKDCTDADTTYTFMVADPSVISVSGDGQITALAEGTTELTVIAGWRGLGGSGLTGGEDAYGLKQVLQITVVAVEK